MGESIILNDAFVEVHLFLDDPEAIRWLKGIADNQRLEMVKRVLKVGITALNSALVGSTAMLFRQALDKWRTDVDATVQKALDQSQKAIVETLQQQFGRQIDPAIQLIERAANEASLRIQERLAQMECRIDPTHPNSWLRAIHEMIDTMRNEFDPNRERSYLWQVRNTLSDYFRRDGEATQCINEAVTRAVEGLQRTLDQIRSSVDIIANRLAPITRGLAFEREVVRDLLRRATAVTGDSLDHVGRDQRPGDWLIGVRFNGSEIGAIVVEVKDEKRNRNQVEQDLDRAMQNRNAQIGILLFANLDQNPYDVPFTILDDSNKMVCVWDEMGSNLNFAYQVARLRLIDRHLRQTAALDRQELLEEIQSALQDVERMRDLQNKAGLVYDRARETFELAREIYNSLRNRLQRIHQQLSRVGVG